MKIYATRRIPEEGLELLRRRFEVVVNPEDRPLAREELLENVRDADGVLGQVTDRIDAEFFDAAGRLKGYANYAVGFDNIDLAEAARRGVPVSNTPGVLTQAVAELAWALLFAAARRVTEADAFVRSGRWTGPSPTAFLGAEVSGATLGVVGAGRIGTAMALMSKGFDMKVLYATGASVNEPLERELGARRTELDELLAASDFVSLHAPLTPETRHLIDAAALRKMKRTAFLINTARGPVADEAALVEALREGRIAGAGLDVFEDEPRLAKGLAELPNVVLAPHIGSATTRARVKMSLMAAENLQAMLQGERPPNLLDPKVLGASAGGRGAPQGN